jgi:prepilin-type N-terminal cleavage/methylation domain-containing protein
MSSSEARRRAGFTLLEVLAAVALLGILYSVLARVAIEGLRAEGESERRLDAVLRVEAQLYETFFAADGSFAVPPVGHEEIEDGEFLLIRDVTPFVPPPEWGVDDEERPQPVLLAPPAAGAQPVVRSVQVSLVWQEGAEQRRVSRRIYAVDFEQAATLAGNAAQNAPPLADVEGAELLEDFAEQIGQLPSETEEAP